MGQGSMIDVPVTIEVVRINPKYMVVKTIEMKMDSVWQEKTATRFVMDDKKNILRYKDGFVSVRVGIKAQ